MSQTRFALILYFFMVAHKSACVTLLAALSKSVKTRYSLCWLTQDFKVEDLFCGAPSCLNTCSLAIIFSAWVLSLFSMTFQHDFLSMTLLG